MYQSQAREGSSVPRRMVGAARLDVDTFEEVEADTGATIQAMAVVILVSLATGVGTLGSGGGLGGLGVGIIFGLLSWSVWALITFVIGTSLFRTPETKANWGQLARTTGFAQSPGVLKILGFIPVIGPVIFVLASVWQLAAMVIAVRQALDYQSTWRALGVVAVGFVVVVIPLLIILSLMGS